MHRTRNCAERATRAPIGIELLGGFHVSVDGVPTSTRGWARRSAAALVKVLALAPGHTLHRERVMDLLWPDEPLERAAPRLHKAAHFARRATGEEDAVVLVAELVRLFPCAEVTVDVVRFEELARVAIDEGDEAAAREALSWYRGELLPGDPYEDWASHRRDLLHLRHLEVLRVASAWRELAELDPTDEEAQTALIHRHLADGDLAAAVHQYQLFERMLERELGLTLGAAPHRLPGASHWPADPIDPSSRTGALVAELGDLIRRGSVVLAELATVAAIPVASLQVAG